ncbi:MAG: aspartate--tRNA(Asn) ligase [Candidatus Aenigmarchaeota archaeon]|nr:aspartate--tRNA(Asn) ligase [Candidatus Aenigmarchaeota archaeon]
MDHMYSNQLRPKQRAKVKGWVDHVRDLGNIRFLTIRDREGMIQVTAKKSDVPSEIFGMVSKLGKEDCVEIEGNVIKSKIAKIGFEIIPSSVKVLAGAEKPLPLDFSGKIESGKDTRFDYRYLDLRNPEVKKIFLTRHKVMGLSHEFFRKEGFVEVHTPVIQAAGAEGGSTLFKFDFYGKEAFLRQSPQLYKQMMMASGLDRVYEIGQAFRAEKFHTRRHISEFMSLDFEISWVDGEEDVMKVLEKLVVYVLKGLKKDGYDLRIPELPLKRVTYDDVLKALNKTGAKIEWGEDIEDAQEKKFAEIMQKKGHEAYFITKFPSKLKPFYIMLDGEVSRGIDLDYRGLELASGGQREHRFDVLTKVMKEKGLDPKDFTFYTDAFRWGMPPHGGIGFGVDRFVKQILKLTDVQETILFPRTPEKLTP